MDETRGGFWCGTGKLWPNTFLLLHLVNLRVSQKTPIKKQSWPNKNSRELAQVCRASGLYILNGRIRGDSLGRFTGCSGLGASVIDYAIADMDPSSFSAFTVIQQTPLSDHNQTNIDIKTNHTPEQNKLETCKLYQRFKWTPEKKLSKP